MTDILLAIIAAELLICAWMLVADFIQKRHRMLQDRWFAIRRRVFKR